MTSQLAIYSMAVVASYITKNYTVDMYNYENEVHRMKMGLEISERELDFFKDIVRINLPNKISIQHSEAVSGIIIPVLQDIREMVNNYDTKGSDSLCYTTARDSLKQLNYEAYTSGESCIAIARTSSKKIFDDVNRLLQDIEHLYLRLEDFIPACSNSTPEVMTDCVGDQLVTMRTDFDYLAERITNVQRNGNELTTNILEENKKCLDKQAGGTNAQATTIKRLAANCVTVYR